MGRFSVSRFLCAVGFWLTLAALSAHAAPYSFRVKHAHSVGGCEGTLLIGESEIRYDTDERADARIWRYTQVKKVERKGARNLVIHTFEDQALQLGRDKAFEFHFLDAMVSDEVFNFVFVRVGQPGNRPASAPPAGGRYEIAAKHEHAFGGCHGTLKITDSYIEFVSARQKDSRLWKYLDIKRLRQPSTYRLSIATYEDQFWQFGRDKTFHLQLKEPMEPAVLEFIRSRMNR